MNAMAVKSVFLAAGKRLFCARLTGNTVVIRLARDAHPGRRRDTHI